ncbi:hypothetical protein G7046_g5558 [Stylonectria norvegica]|nr:hypothetical protein G7046_g5558 [Stylonectria norvegica]
MPQSGQFFTNLQLDRLLRGLRQDTVSFLGLCRLDKDGVARTYDIDRNVLGAVGLNPAMIKAFLDRCPFSQVLEDRFRGVDGTRVSQTDLFHPSQDVAAPPLTEEAKERMKLAHEEELRRDPGTVAARTAAMRMGTWGWPPIANDSNYNLMVNGTS